MLFALALRPLKCISSCSALIDFKPSAEKDARKAGVNYNAARLSVLTISFLIYDFPGSQKQVVLVYNFSNNIAAILGLGGILPMQLTNIC